MGFFSSLGQVISNRQYFREYEQRQRDVAEQRKELAKINPPTPEELEKAKKEGKVLIDIVDIMDTHSEDVAENTETATIIPQMLIPYFSTAAAGGLSLKFIAKPAIRQYQDTKNDFRIKNEEQFNNWAQEIIKKLNITDYWEQYEIRDNFYNKKKLEELLKKTDDEDIKNIYEQAIKKFDEFSLDKAAKKLKAKGATAAIIPAATLAASFVASTIWATKLQVNSSRIARWQSREQLENPKYFVQFTPEQIQEAQKNLEAKEKEDKKFANKLFKRQNKASLLKVIKDNKAYKAWRAQDKDESKKVQRQLSKEELLDAKRDKEVIQRITRVINNKAEDYSENMEVAADTIIMGTPFLGAAVGRVISFVVNKFDFIDKYADAKVKNFAQSLGEYDKKEVLQAYKELKEHKKGAPGGFVKSLNLFGSIFDAEEKGVKTDGIDALMSYFKKIYTFGISTNGARKGAISLMGALVAGITGAVIGLKLQKASARAGRFLAKRELEKDPQNFIGYSDEELKQVENVKSEKPSVGQKFKEYITFIPRVLGEYFEYQKYVKTSAAKNRALKEELVKLDVSEEQLREAKNVQRKLFNTFEKVDDKSQEYSESVEAAVEIAKPVIVSMGFATLISPFAIFALQAARGKITPSGAIEKLTKFLSNHTDFLKGKKVNNYLTKVKDNFNYVISDTKMSDYDKERIFKDVLSKFVDKDTLKQFDSLYGDEREQLFKVLDIQLREFTDELVQELDTKMIKEYLNEAKERARNMSEEDFQKIMQSNKKMKALFSKSDKKQFGAILENLEKTLDNLPQEKLDELINTVKEAISKNPYEVLNLFNNAGKLKDIFVTKGITASIAAAGASWTALNLLVTFTIESYLAKLQKEAGRLGVIKALDELDDPMYYADSEAPTTSSNTPEENAVQENQLAKNKYLL